MKRRRKYVPLLSVITVVVLCLPGCDQRSDETSQGSPSAVSLSVASSSSPRGASSTHANIQPSLDSQAEDDHHTNGDATDGGVVGKKTHHPS
ncbi:hypothetical protein [Corynebacterium sp. c7Ub_26]